MKTASLALVIPLAAVLAGGVSGFVQHALAPTPIAASSIAPPSEPTAALREGLARLGSIERLLQDLTIERPSEPEARASERRPLSAPTAELAPLETLETLIDRIEGVERRLADRVTTTDPKFATDSPFGRLREDDWTALGALFADDLDVAQDRAQERYLFAPLGQLLTEFGRPDKCLRQEDGTLVLHYEHVERELERRIEFLLHDGYVIRIWLFRWDR